MTDGKGNAVSNESYLRTLLRVRGFSEVRLLPTVHAGFVNVFQTCDHMRFSWSPSSCLHALLL
jgi:hypothetical protein